MSDESLTAALAEYQALRNDINLTLQGFYQIYAIYFTALGFFYGYVVVNQIVDFILAVPLVALALFLRLHYDQLMIERMAKYLLSVSQTQVPKIIAAHSTETTQNPSDVMQWEQVNRKDPLPHYYKWSMFIVFVVLSILPPVAYNLHNISGFCLGPHRSALPMCAQWLSLVVNLGIGGWITFRIIADVY